MKIIKISLLILVFALVSCEDDNPVEPVQYSLSGVVVSAEDESPMSNVVVLLDSEVKDTTGSDGSFAITGVQSGSHELSFIYPYSEEYNEEITITSDTNLEVKLMSTLQYDYFPMDWTEKEFDYRYASSSTSGAASYGSGTATWTIISSRDSSGIIIYKVKDNRVFNDTSRTLNENTGAYEYTYKEVSQTNYFDILENTNVLADTIKFMGLNSIIRNSTLEEGPSFPRYSELDVDELEIYQPYFTRFYLKKDLGLTKISYETSGNSHSSVEYKLKQ